MRGIINPPKCCSSWSDHFNTVMKADDDLESRVKELEIILLPIALKFRESPKKTQDFDDQINECAAKIAHTLNQLADLPGDHYESHNALKALNELELLALMKGCK